MSSNSIKEYYWICSVCGLEFESRHKLQNHRKTDNHSAIVKTRQIHKCDFCGKEWITTKEGYSNHTTQCACNPNRIIRKPAFTRDTMSDETRHKISEGRKRTILKQGELQNLKHRSYHYNDMIFSSTYELKYALFCEEHNINYVLHPKPIPYIFNGEQHLYFPDFYIPSEDKYVDPKNSYLINYPQKHLGISDSDKIAIVSKQNNIIIEIIDGKNIQCDQNKLDHIIKANKESGLYIKHTNKSNSSISTSKLEAKQLAKTQLKLIKLIKLRISNLKKESFGYTKEIRHKMSIKATGSNNSMFGKHWYTNGVTSIVSTDCPPGFYPGRSKQ